MFILLSHFDNCHIHCNQDNHDDHCLVQVTTESSLGAWSDYIRSWSQSSEYNFQHCHHRHYRHYHQDHHHQDQSSPGLGSSRCRCRKGKRLRIVLSQHFLTLAGHNDDDDDDVDDNHDDDNNAGNHKRPTQDISKICKISLK